MSTKARTLKKTLFPYPAGNFQYECAFKTRKKRNLLLASVAVCLQQILFKFPPASPVGGIIYFQLRVKELAQPYLIHHDSIHYIHRILPLVLMTAFNETIPDLIFFFLGIDFYAIQWSYIRIPFSFVEKRQCVISNNYFRKNQKIVSHYTTALTTSTVVKFLEYSKQKTPRTFCCFTFSINLHF